MLSWLWHLQRMCFSWEMPVSSPSVWTVAFGARILQRSRCFSELALRKPIMAGCLPHHCYGQIVSLDSCFLLHLLTLNMQRDGYPVFSQTCKYWSLWSECSLGWEREWFLAIIPCGFSFSFPLFSAKSYYNLKGTNFFSDSLLPLFIVCGSSFDILCTHHNVGFGSSIVSSQQQSFPFCRADARFAFVYKAVVASRPPLGNKLKFLKFLPYLASILQLTMTTPVPSVPAVIHLFIPTACTNGFSIVILVIILLLACQEMPMFLNSSAFRCMERYLDAIQGIKPFPNSLMPLSHIKIFPGLSYNFKEVVLSLSTFG